MKVTASILNRVAKDKGTRIPSVFVEKASISPNGRYGKVLFRLGTSTELAKDTINNKKALIEAFDAKLQGTARLVVASVHSTEHKDLYCGYVKLNDERMSMEMANARNFNQITANMFADPDDHIWNVEESAEGKILVRTSEDNLQELLNTKVAPPNMHVAAAGYALDGTVTSGQMVAYYDDKAEEIRKGIMIDNASVYDFKFNKVKELASCDLVGAAPAIKEVATSIDKLFKDPNKRYTELASPSKTAVTRYLTLLYSQNKEFLNAYLKKIDEFLTV